MKLEITKVDWGNVKAAISQGGNIWEHKLLVDFKRKIKNYNRYLQSEQCCYCRRSLADEFNMVIDIEHVLPKGHFRHLMFETYNLSVSCKRCNMEIKGEDISFITDINAVNANPMDKELYLLIHPNLDEYFKHIKYYSKTVNAKSIVKYKVLDKSIKGEFTYKYFELSEIESESLNQAQGIKISEKLSTKIPLTISSSIQKLLKKK
jgi:uncharacterized protein (TIGR02646 family)